LMKLGIDSAPSIALEIDAPIPELPFEFPVVVKVLHDQIAHKTEVGGVVLNVRNEAELHRAINTIGKSVSEYLPDIALTKVLVQAQTRGVGEVLIGLRRDPEVGYLVMLAAGGVMTEIYRDRSMRLAPVTIESAREMIAEVKGLKALAGFRGKPKGDLEAVAQSLVNLSRLASLSNAVVDEAEVNPLIVMPEGEGVLAVDGLITVFTQ
jgi:succinyl-CoA synthetase beta subunit